MIHWAKQAMLSGNRENKDTNANGLVAAGQLKSDPGPLLVFPTRLHVLSDTIEAQTQAHTPSERANRRDPRQALCTKQDGVSTASHGSPFLVVRSAERNEPSKSTRANTWKANMESCGQSRRHQARGFLAQELIYFQETEEPSPFITLAAPKKNLAIQPCWRFRRAGHCTSISKQLNVASR